MRAIVQQSKDPFLHSLMIPWMAEFVVPGQEAEKVLGVARDGSRKAYGIYMIFK